MTYVPRWTLTTVTDFSPSIFTPLVRLLRIASRVEMQAGLFRSVLLVAAIPALHGTSGISFGIAFKREARQKLEPRHLGLIPSESAPTTSFASNTLISRRVRPPSCAALQPFISRSNAATAGVPRHISSSEIDIVSKTYRTATR